MARKIPTRSYLFYALPICTMKTIVCQSWKLYVRFYIFNPAVFLTISQKALGTLFVSVCVPFVTVPICILSQLVTVKKLLANSFDSEIVFRYFKGNCQVIAFLFRVIEISNKYHKHEAHYTKQIDLGMTKGFVHRSTVVCTIC